MIRYTLNIEIILKSYWCIIEFHITEDRSLYLLLYFFTKIKQKRNFLHIFLSCLIYFGIGRSLPLCIDSIFTPYLCFDPTNCSSYKWLRLNSHALLCMPLTLSLCLHTTSCHSIFSENFFQQLLSDLFSQFFCFSQPPSNVPLYSLLCAAPPSSEH